MELQELLEQRFSRKIQARTESVTDSPADWIEKYFYVPDPRDLVTAEFLPPGPMILTEHQKRIINEALSKDSKGMRKYSTVIYSAPKKSGKSAIASAVTMYMAYSRPDSFVYCLANDGKQSADRIYAPICECIRRHRQLDGPLSKETPKQNKLVLSNNTTIEAITCDATGEAGAQPLFTAWSEMWGFTSKAKERLWTELTVPPTLHGLAMRWVESYAGFVGESAVLERLYESTVVKGTPHPGFQDLVNEDGSPTVFVNKAARMFCYWDRTRRMAWQTPEFYAEEEMNHPPSEFRRIHYNEWVASAAAFIQPEMWEAIKKPVGPLRGDTPLVLGVDGAISNDFATIVGVTRDSDNNEHNLVRFCYIFTPAQGGGTIKISETLEPRIRELCQKYNVVCCAYDRFQLEDMAQRLRKDKVCWMYPFGQQGDRAVADKGLYDAIVNRTLWWDADGPNLDKQGEVPSLYQHVTQAGTKNVNGRMRLEKLSNNAKIDAAVALSMANDQCKKLAISNSERDIDRALRMHTMGKITDDEFLSRVRAR